MVSEDMLFRGHFYFVGWTDPRHFHGGVLWFPGKPMEAIKLVSEKYEVHCEALDKKNVWHQSDHEGICGTTGQALSLIGIKITTESSDHNIYYRVSTTKGGWTPLCKNGELCGDATFIPGSYIDGIQIIFSEKCISQEQVLDDANFRLAYCQKRINQTFVREEGKNQLLMAMTQDYCHYDDVVCNIVEKGMILPLRVIPSATPLAINWAGGVTDQDGNFVAGHFRKYQSNSMNLCCEKAYEVSEDEVEYLDETVVYGGVMLRHFGHFFTESLSRLWYIVENESDNFPIAILTQSETSAFYKEFFTLLGIEDDRIRIISKPTQFKKIIVPEQTLYLWSGYKEKANLVYNKLMENCTRKESVCFDKVYLSRTKFSQSESVNSEYFDDFLSKNGYTVLQLEKYPLSKQIAILARANEVICTEGTLSHLALFCRPNTKFVVFRRDDTTILKPQMLISQMKQVDLSYVDVTYNFLPTQHVTGQFLYGPTPEFMKWLDFNGIAYSKDEVDFDLDKYCGQYVKQWCENCNAPRRFEQISKYDMFDVLSRMNRIFGNPPITRKKYVTAIKRREQELLEQNAHLREENERLKNMIEEIKNCLSK